MRVFLLVCLIGVTCAEISLHAVFQAKWKTFKATHKKSYHPEEEEKRLGTFLTNSLHIEQHNERFAKGLETFQMAHNELSDMTIDELVKKKTGLKSRPASARANNTVFDASALASLKLPSKVDWSSYIPDVRNQGECGSCYAFSAAGTLEGILARKLSRNGVPPKPIHLSEQQFVDCSHKYDNAGCDGGFMDSCFKFARDNKGITTHDKYPYAGKVQKCNARVPNDARLAVTKITDVKPTEAAVTAAVATVGPLAVAVHAGNRAFQLYSGGILNDANCGKGEADHAVILVGYGEENGQKYYKIKNSWGTTWGERGFIRIARDKCHVTTEAVYPTL